MQTWQFNMMIHSSGHNLTPTQRDKLIICTAFDIKVFYRKPTFLSSAPWYIRPGLYHQPNQGIVIREHFPSPRSSSMSARTNLRAISPRQSAMVISLYVCYSMSNDFPSMHFWFRALFKAHMQSSEIANHTRTSWQAYSLGPFSTSTLTSKPLLSSCLTRVTFISTLHRPAQNIWLWIMICTCGNLLRNRRDGRAV